MKDNWKKILENIKIIAETFNASWPIIKMILVVAGTYFVAVMMVNTGKQDEMDTYVAQYQEYKKKADSTAVYAQTLKGAVAVQERKAASAQARAVELNKQVATLSVRTAVLVERRDSLLETLDSTKTVTDSLQHYINTKTIQDSIIATQDTIIKNQTSQIQQLNVALAHKDTSILYLTTSRDSLLTIIKKMPAAPSNPNRTIFGIKMPSRKNTFIVGAIIGAATTAVILR